MLTHDNFCFSHIHVHKFTKKLLILHTQSNTLLRVVWMHCMGLVSTDHERLRDGLLKGHGVLRAGRDPPQDPFKDGGHGSLGALGTNLRGEGASSRSC